MGNALIAFAQPSHQRQPLSDAATGTRVPTVSSVVSERAVCLLLVP